MDGENDGKPYQNGWFWGEKNHIFGNIHIGVLTIFWITQTSKFRSSATTTKLKKAGASCTPRAGGFYKRPVLDRDHWTLQGKEFRKVGDWTNPFEQICKSQIGSFLQGSGWKSTNIWSCHHLPESQSSTSFSQGVKGEVKSAWFMVLDVNGI